jgi:hypothetical protein
MNPTQGMNKDDSVLDGVVAKPIQLEESRSDAVVNGDIFDGHSDLYLGDIDVATRQIPIKLHIYVDGWYYEYTVTNRIEVDKSAPSETNPAPA